MTSEQKVNIMAEETGSRSLAVDETATLTLIDSMKNDRTAALVIITYAKLNLSNINM
jgi:hypothetical protein